MTGTQTWYQHTCEWSTWCLVWLYTGTYLGLTKSEAVKISFHTTAGKYLDITLKNAQLLLLRAESRKYQNGDHANICTVFR
jgi:hypothetical protein